ncbi:MAG: efflux RND transporter periplasmic adaptor subunit [Oligoflexales bacterium]
MKKRSVITSMVLLLFLVLGAYSVYLKKYRNYSRIAPRSGPIVESIYGVGTVKPKRKYVFRVGVSKNISAILVSEGDYVKKGHSVAVLDDTLRLKAPFAGMITALYYQEGEIVFPNTPFIDLADMQKTFVEASLDQKSVMRLEKNMKAVMSFESIRNELFEGKVFKIFPREKQFIVHIMPKDLPKQILPGMTGDIAIEVGRRDKAMLIPVLAILDGYVLIEREGKRQKIAVEIGHMDNEWAEVTNNAIRLSDYILMKDR